MRFPRFFAFRPTRRAVRSGANVSSPSSSAEAGCGEPAGDRDAADLDSLQPSRCVPWELSGHRCSCRRGDDSGARLVSAMAISDFGYAHRVRPGSRMGRLRVLTGSKL